MIIEKECENADQGGRNKVNDYKSKTKEKERSNG